MIRKIVMCVVLLFVLTIQLSGVALAGGGVPAGVTLLAWGVGTNGNNSIINLNYSNGFSTDISLKVPLDPSWRKLNDVRPILEAYKEGYGPNLGGVGGILGTDINFAPNVLAAMKVQNFNPAQVGGADIPPSATTITPDQKAWLEKGGYAVDESSPVQTPSSTPKQTPKAPSNQAQASNPVVTPTQSSNNESSSAPSNKNSQTVTPPPKSEPAVGETVQTTSGPMTEEMVVANQGLVAQNPPSPNPANIPIKELAEKESSLRGIQWMWVSAGGGILALLGVVGWVLYRRNKES